MPYPWEKDFYTSGKGTDLWDIATLGASSEGGKDWIGDRWNDLTGKTAADRAAREQRRALSLATESQERMFNQSLETQKPWLEAGQRGLGMLESGLESGRFDVNTGLGSLREGLDSGKYDVENPEFEFDFEADPGYKFRLSESLGAIESSRAARGGLFSGGTGQALQERSQGLASQEYGKAYDRAYGAFGDKFNRERALKGDLFNRDWTVGSDEYNRAVSSTTADYNRLASLSGVGQLSSQNIGSQQMIQGGNLANLHLQGGNIGAQKAMAGYQGGMNLLNTGLQIGGMAAAAMSDKRLKENINHVGSENGHNIYHFNYIDDTRKFKGVMAQEVLKKMPEAVTKIDGYYAVNYDKIGVVMEEV